MKRLYSRLHSNSSVAVPEGVCAIESGCLTFKSASDEELSYPFECLMDLGTEASVVAVGLPTSFYDKDGRGYMLDIMENIPSLTGLDNVKVLRIDMTKYGSPITLERDFIVASRTPISVRTGIVKYPVSYVSDLAYHPSIVRSNNVLNPGMHDLYGYVSSATNFLPRIGSWLNAFLVVERVYGNTLTIGRLKNADMNVLYGSSGSRSMDYYQRATPSAALTTLLGSLQCN